MTLRILRFSVYVSHHMYVSQIAEVTVGAKSGSQAGEISPSIEASSSLCLHLPPLRPSRPRLPFNLTQRGIVLSMIRRG
jgi:hypothetical protein